jgi:RNA polymerase sigma-70 factor, ECF subfamily
MEVRLITRSVIRRGGRSRHAPRDEPFWQPQHEWRRARFYLPGWSSRSMSSVSRSRIRKNSEAGRLAVSQPEVLRNDSMTESFDNLCAGLRAGNQASARELFTRFATRLVALARSRMNARLQQKVDPEDVVQSVYKSFLLRAADGQFEFDNWDSLWTILAVITLRKCGHRAEYFRAACRDVRREQVFATLSTDESVVSFEAIAREPHPSEAALFTETLERVMRRLDQRDQQMLTLRLQGYSTTEIAPLVGRTDRTVRLVLERIRKLLESERDA